MNKDKRNYIIAYCVIMALLIGYGTIFCIGVKNLAPWTDSDHAFIIPIGILTGLGFFVSKELKEITDKEKAEAKKKEKEEAEK